MRFACSRAGRIACTLVASQLLCTSLAVAAPPLPPAAAAQPLVMDEVRLSDGTIARGIVVERTSEGDVTFLTATGETRHYAKKDIVYAGPLGGAAASPAPAPSSAPFPSLIPPALVPPAAPTAGGVPVPVRVDASGVQVHVREASSRLVLTAPGSPGSAELAGDTYRPLCIAPCSPLLLPGPHLFALSQNDGKLADVATPVDAKPGETIAFHFDSHERTRTAGTVLFWTGFGSAAVSIATGLVIGLTASNNAQPGTAAWDSGEQGASSQVHAGVGVAVTGALIGAGLLVAGVFMNKSRDEATLAPKDEPTPVAVKTSPTPAPADPVVTHPVIEREAGGFN